MNTSILTTRVNPSVQAVITSLYEDARLDPIRAAKGMAKSMFRSLQPKDMESVYLPISQEQGEFFHELITENHLKNVVEFGTSFGISTLFLADAARAIGGQVITTELMESKAHVAKKNFVSAKVSDHIEVKIGDALQTLKDLRQPIDFLMLDGWKNLYLPLFRQLEPLFHKNTIIYADNVDMSDAQPYLRYIYSKEGIYSSRKLHNGKGELTVIKQKNDNQLTIM